MSGRAEQKRRSYAVADLKAAVRSMSGRNAEHAERIRTLEAALQFYAVADVLYLGKGDYRTTLAELVQDNGATARAALAGCGTCGQTLCVCPAGEASDD